MLLNRFIFSSLLLIIFFSPQKLLAQNLEFFGAASQGMVAPVNYEGTPNFGLSTNLEIGAYINDNYAAKIGYGYSYLVADFQTFNQLYVSGIYRVFMDSEVYPFVGLGVGANFNLFQVDNQVRIATFGEMGVEIYNYTFSMKINYYNPRVVQGVALGYVYNFSEWF